VQTTDGGGSLVHVQRKWRDRFSHTCAGRQLLRIDFAGDTAAPAGRVNMYIT